MTTDPGKKGGQLSAADVEGSLRRFPFGVAHALARVAWHDAWWRALARMQEVRPSAVPAGEVDESMQRASAAREAWRALAGTWADGPRGQAEGTEVVSALLQMSEAAAKHASIRRLPIPTDDSAKDKAKDPESRQRQRVAEEESYREFEAGVATLKAHPGVLAEPLRSAAAEMIWAAAWHPSNRMSDWLEKDDDTDDDEDDDEDDSDEEDDDEEDDEDDDSKRFGEEYPGAPGDAVQNLIDVCSSLKECHWDSPTWWCGVRLDLSHVASAGEVSSLLQDIAKVPGTFGNPGLNCVRIVVPERRSDAGDPLGDHVRAALLSAEDLGLLVMLEVPVVATEACETWVGDLARAATSSKCIRGVAFTTVADDHAGGDTVTDFAALLAALRSGGLDQARCMVTFPAPNNDVVDADDEWVASYAALYNVREFPAEGVAVVPMGVCIEDGNAFPEFHADTRSLKDADGDPLSDPHDVLDAASAVYNITQYVGLVTGLSLMLPAEVEEGPAFGDAWYVEYGQRLMSACGESELGFFFESWACPDGENDAHHLGLRELLAKGHIDLSRDVLELAPTGASHTASVVYLPGFTCNGCEYLTEPSYFYRKKEKPKKKKKTGDDDDEDEEFEPFPGLKVLIPFAPKRRITAYHGEEDHAWHDYITDEEGEKEDEYPMQDVAEQTARIHAILDKEAERVGSKNVFLGGASQGCGMAMHVGLTYPKPLGGLIGTMGHVLTPTPITAEWLSHKVPVYVYIGLADTTMPWEKWVKATWQRLENAGAQVHIHLEEDVDHGECEEKWIPAFLESVLPKAPSKNKKGGKKK